MKYTSEKCIFVVLRDRNYAICVSTILWRLAYWITHQSRTASIIQTNYMLNFNTKARHIILQDKGTSSPSACHKKVNGDVETVPLTVNPGSKQRRVVSSGPLSLYSKGNSSQYLSNGRLVRPQNWSR